MKGRWIDFLTGVTGIPDSFIFSDIILSPNSQVIKKSNENRLPLYIFTILAIKNIQNNSYH